MRFKLTLYVDKQQSGNRLPFNYQYEQSGVIYKMLSHADEQYAAWLHDNGFRQEGKQFRLFTYSQLEIPEYRIDKQSGAIQILSDTVCWYISFLPEQSTEQFILGVFGDQSFELGNWKHKVSFQIRQVELLPPPDFDKTTVFETLSPICISLRNDANQSVYLSPADAKAPEAILTSLINRYETFYQKTFDGSRHILFKLLSEPRPKLITFKGGTREESKVKGYMCRFELIADKDLMKVMYAAGIGNKGNSMGFGMVKGL